eukprot:g47160.t1
MSLASVDWSIFKNSATNLSECATTITDFISKYVKDYMPKKFVQDFPNWKPWMERKTHSSLKFRSEVFKSGDPDLRRKSRYNLQKAIRVAKRQYQTKVESQTNHMNAHRLWKGSHDIMSYKVSEVMPPAPTASGAPLPTVTATDGHIGPFLRVNPDGVPSHALRSCADQLAGVFADFFNFLLRCEVSTCLKKTIIVPVPKENQATCLNDYCPVALTSIIMKCFM